MRLDLATQRSQHALLAQSEDRLVAVLDWGDAFRGDPAFDLTPLLLWDPISTRDALSDRSPEAGLLERGVAYGIRRGLAMLKAYERWDAEARDRHLKVLEQLQQVIP